MNNFENIKSMNIEDLARQNVRHITYMSGYTASSLFITSDECEYDNKNEAIEHEKNWLAQEV